MNPDEDLLERLLVSRRRVMSGPSGPSAAEFAASVHCAERTVRRYLTGERPVPASVLEIWERVTGLSKGSLLRGPAQVPDLVGREAELTLLTALLDDASPVSICQVAGESGIGKTTLMRRFADVARSLGSVVLWGTCLADGAGAFDPIAQALRPLGVDMRRLLDDGRGTPHEPSGDVGARSLHLAVADRIPRTPTGRRTVIVLDDVQLAAPSLVRLLVHLAAHATELNLAMFLVVNSSVAPPDPETAAMLPALLERPDSMCCSITGLEHDAVRVLVHRLVPNQQQRPTDRYVRAMATSTGGNPFRIVRELRRRVEGDGPGSGDGDAVAMLRVASVIGLTFDTLVLRDVLRRRGEGLARSVPDQLPRAGEPELALALGEAARLGIVTKLDERSWMFAHQLYRNEARRQLPEQVIASLHRTVAEVLLDHRARHEVSDPIAAEVIAHHLRRCDGHDAVVAAEVFLESAVEAFRSVDLIGAAAHASDGLGLDAWSITRGLVDARPCSAEGRMDLPSTLRADLLLIRARARFEAEPTLARVDAMASAEAARTGQDVRRLVAAAVAASDFVIVGQPDEHVDRLCAEALASLPSEAVGERAQLQAAWAANIIWSGTATVDELRIADELLQASIVSAQGIGAVEVVERSLHARCVALHGSPQLNARRRIAHDLETLTGRPTWHLGLAALALGDRYAFERQRDRMAVSRHPWDQATAHLWDALGACLDGRWGDVMPAADRAVELFPNNPNFANSHAFRFIALVWEQGRVGEVIDGIELLLGQYPGLRPYHAALALAYWDLGRTEVAAAVVEDIARTLHTSAPDFGYPLVLSILVEVGVLTGRLDDAREAAELLAPFSGQLIVVPAGSHVHGAADRFLGIAADALGRPAQADEHFARARLLEDRLGGTTLAVRTELWCAAGLLRRVDVQDRRTGASRLEQVVVDAERLSMGSPAALARGFLARR